MALIKNINSGSVNGIVITGSLNVSGSITTNNIINSQMFMNPQTITNDINIPAQYNAFLIGPVGFSGTVTVGSGSNLSIL